MKNICIVLFLLLAQITLAQSRLVTYSAPKGAELKSDYTVKVRTTGKEWKTVDTYAVKVYKNSDGGTVEKASMGYFDFEGEVEVAVTSNNENVKSVIVRPLSYDIKTKIQGNTVIFKLDKPSNLSVETNGDIFHNLHLFANPLETYRLGKKDIYFAPGIHQLLGDTMMVKSGQTVYIAGGAIVRGTIKVNGVSNVKVLGRGEIHPVGRGEGIYVSNSRNIKVEGIVTTQCPVGGSYGVEISNVKSISSYGWGDGMNVFASSNVYYDGVFCRNSDDCSTVYATRKGFVGGCKNITMVNSTLWADVAHPIFIGLHGNVEHPDTIDGVTYRNIDILDECEKQIDYQGCMAINSGDNNLVRNVTFENIRIEDIRQGQLLDMRISFNHKYCKAPGRGIENIFFKDVTYNGNNAEISIISGYDDSRKIKNVRFENLRINNTLINDDMAGKPKWYKTGDMARIFIGEHVDNVTFNAKAK